MGIVLFSGRSDIGRMFLFYIYILCICSYNPQMFGINLSNYICLIGFIYTVIKNKKLVLLGKKNRIWTTIIAFTLLSILSLLITQNLAVSVRTFLKFVSLIFAVLWCNLLLTKDGQADEMWKLLRVANIVACCIGLYQLVFNVGDYHLAYGTENDAIRLVGAFPTPNIYAGFLCLTIPSVLLEAKNNKKIIIVLLANLLVLYNTYSRSSILVLVISTIIFFLINYLFVDKKLKMNSKKLMYMLGVFIAGCFGLYYLIKSGKLNFLFQRRDSNSIRIKSILTAFNVFVQNPLGTGIGVGIGSVLDSGYISVMVDLGLAGIILILMLTHYTMESSIKINVRDKNIYNQTLLFTTIIFWMINILESAFYNSLLNPVLAILICELHANRRRVRYNRCIR